MIIAIDIETIPNPDTFDSLPEPECTDSRIKDPAKIAAHIADKKAKQREDAALDPLTGRICSCALAVVGVPDKERAWCIEEPTNKAEREIVQSIMQTLAGADVRLVTWNGNNFDLPYIYKRAMCLGIDPGHFGAPPLPAWTKRYNTDRHYDLMAIWQAWSGYAKLDTVAAMVLGERKIEIDVKTFPELIKTKEGREKLAEYNLMDSRLTARLWEKMNGVMFA